MPQSLPEGFIIYNDEAYRLGTIHVRGTLSCAVMETEVLSAVGASIVNGIQLSDFQRQPVQNENDRLRRRSPLSIVRLLAERAKAAGLHLFCALSFEAASIFDDLDLPADDFAEFIVTEATKCSVQEFIAHRANDPRGNETQPRPSFTITSDTSDRFEKIFDAAKHHFKVGDIFEVVLSRRFEFEASDDKSFAYLGHRIASLRAPYRFALPFLRTQLVGASPELLVHVSGRTVTNRPISGSMRRTAATTALSTEEQTTLAGLYASEKEKSELDMLVDLARHDLHRVCDDVEVSAYREALVLETVVHTQSTVRGSLKPQYDGLDAVFSCLNAGTLVGAPKKKAMQIIAALEGTPRRFYGGNLIHIIPGKHEDVRSTILIRTFQIANRKVTLQAGATLLYESRQDFEYWECGSKAKALLDLVGHGARAHGPGAPPPIDERSHSELGTFEYLASFSAIPTTARVPDSVAKTPLRLLLIDNHDSFTFNLAALFEHLGCHVTVVRNDRSLPPSDSFDALLLSPGPSAPRDAGHLIAIIKAFWLHKPMFGVCLGFQAMIEARGGELGVLQEPLHGKVRSVRQLCPSIFFNDLPESFAVARYHSLYGKVIPADIRIIAADGAEVPMALDTFLNDGDTDATGQTRAALPHCAVQFHPESFMTATNGVLIASNWVNAVQSYLKKEQPQRSIQPTDEATKTIQSKALALVQQILDKEPSGLFLETSLSEALRLGGRVLAEAVRLLRQHATVGSDLRAVADSIKASGGEIFEVCGTGGTKSLRLNTSTLTALYAGAADLCVVKHGGRSASGHKGSLDLLEHLGLAPETLYHCAGESLRAYGISFLGAGFTYAPFARYAPVRKAYGKPTIFNLLGPLLNPAQPTFRLMGCFDEAYLPLLADTLLALGEDGAVVVGRDAYGPIDEIHPRGQTLVAMVQDGQVTFGELPPFVSAPNPLNRQDIFADGLQAAEIILGSGKEIPADPLKKEAAQYGLEFILANLALLLFAQGRQKTQTTEGSQNALDVTAIQKHFAALVTSSSELTIAADALRHALSRLAQTNPKSPLAQERPFSKQANSDHANHVNSGNQSTNRPTSWPAAEFPLLSERAAKLWNCLQPVIIAEIKLKTPLVKFQPVDVAAQVARYTQASASAISVVTHPLFSGSKKLLQQIRSLTDLPIIAKDFIRTTEQADALVAAGADAVLLLEDWLGVQQTAQIGSALRSKGILPVVESTLRVPEAQQYPFEFVPLLNTRNLFNLTLGSRFRQTLAQSAPHAVSASDIKTAVDGFFSCKQNRGILVGEALMRAGALDQENVASGEPEAINNFVRHCQKPFLFKACGARSPDHLHTALEAGADLVGVNLLPQSRRYCTPAELQTIVNAVLTNPEIANHFVVLTGQETPTGSLKILQSLGHEILMRVHEQPYGSSVLRRLLPPESAQAIRILSPFFGYRKNTMVVYGAQAAIIDSSSPGSGVAEKIPECPARLANLPTLVAGGVTAANLQARLDEATKQGWTIAGIDVASGVSAPNGFGFNTERIRELATALQEQAARRQIHT